MGKCIKTGWRVMVFLFFLTIITLTNTGSVLAASSSGWALINWSQATFTLSNTAAVIDWGAVPTLGIPSTQGSFSGTSVGLNGQPDIYTADFADGGPWSNTSAVSSQTLASNALTASANTGTPATPFDPTTAFPANQIFASSDLNIVSMSSFGNVFSQAVLSGQFTVSQDTNLLISVPYSLSLAMNNGNAVYNLADVTAALVLSDFDTTDPITSQSLILFQDAQTLSATGAASGLLNLNYNLLAFQPGTTIPFNYDLEASSTATASAAVPVPASFVLLAGGLLGLIAARRKV